MKKGFALIELVATITILSLIASFTFPSVNKTIKEKKEKLYGIQVDNIESSAISYIDKNGLFKDNDKVIVTLCQLKQSGFTDEKIKNPINNKYIPDDSMVIVTKNDKDFKKEFFYGTDGYTSCTINDNILFEYIEINSVYNDSLDNGLYNIIIHDGDIEVESIDTSKLNTYFIEYNDKENNINNIKKYLYIVDTTEPEIIYKDNINGSNEIGKSIIEINASQNKFSPYEVISYDNSKEEIIPIISSNVNLKIVGTYYINYKATDSSFNSVIKTQTIKVVDNDGPIINKIEGNPNTKTSMSAIISVDAYDTGVGLNPHGAYSFDGGKTWQVSNSITVDNNMTLDIVVRDAVFNETKQTIKITNILKDDNSILFSVKNGELKNNNWYITDIDVLVKPLVSSEYFESFDYCISNTICTPDINSVNYDGEIVKLSENTNGTFICAKVNKKNNTSTDVLCSTQFKIDKSIPDISYSVKSGKQNEGYEPWYISDVALNISTTSISGIDKIEYCTTLGESEDVEENITCAPNIMVNDLTTDIILNSNSEYNKVCSIITNKAGIKSDLTCSSNYSIDKNIPDVNLEISGDYYENYIGKKVSIKANVIPSSTESRYTYIWYKKDKENYIEIQNGISNEIIISNADNIYSNVIYKVVVITGAGNKGDAFKEVEVDTVKPTCILTANGTIGNNGWFISKSVVINATFKDSGSGVGSKGIGLKDSYNDEIVYNISTNTSGTTVYCSVIDKVGNKESNSIVVKKTGENSCKLLEENADKEAELKQKISYVAYGEEISYESLVEITVPECYEIETIIVKEGADILKDGATVFKSISDLSVGKHTLNYTVTTTNGKKVEKDFDIMIYIPLECSSNITEDGNDNGLYRDSINPNRCIFKGSTPNNYIMFNSTYDEDSSIPNKDGQLYRIVSIEADNSIKIVSNKSIGKSKWNNTYKNVSWNDDITIKKYLENYYDQDLNEVAKKQIKPTKFYIKRMYYNYSGQDSMHYTIEQTVELETSKDAIADKESYIGLLYVYDFLLASGNINSENPCIKTTKWKNIGSPKKVCDINNWLVPTEDEVDERDYKSFWFMTLSDKRKARYWSNGVYGSVWRENVNESKRAVLPALYLSENVKIVAGTGTKEDPYLIGKELYSK